MRQRMVREVFLVVVLCVAFGLPARAQTVTATLEGRILDATGAILPGATVTVVNPLTGFSRLAVTNDSGEYRILLLPVGEYTVTVERTGFRREVKKVRLEIGQIATLEITLAVGEVAERMVVEEAGTALETTRTEVSSVISESQIENLPVNGRQFIDFALLAPGLQIGDTTSGSTDVIVEPVTKLSFAGQNIHFNFIAVDGADNISTASGVQRTSPSQEAAREFRVVNTVYSTEFGRAVGGIVNIITRSGTNEFHGSIYDFFRNNKLDARSILASPGFNTLRQNQFGGTLGGPVQKDRTFFFLNYEGQRRGESPFYNSAILSNITAINNAKVTRFGLLPENLNVLRKSNGDNFLFKLDHNLSQRHNLSTRYFFNDVRLTNVSPLNDGFDLPSGFRDNFLRDQSLVTNLTSTFSSTLLNELRGQYSHRSFDFPSASTQPHLEVANTFTIGVNRGNPEFYKESRFELVDNLTLNRGKHTLGFGGNFNFVRTTESFPLFFPFEATFASVNDLLNGSPFVIFFEKFDFSATRVDTSIYRGQRFAENFRNQAKGVLNHTYNGVFLQDKWHTTPKLTVNFGVRYDVETWPAKALSNDTNNFDPRLGFAYNVSPKWNFVIRGGFGIFHGIIPAPLLMCQIPSCGGSGPFPGREAKENQLNANTRLFAFGADPATMQTAFNNIIRTGLYPTGASEAVIVRFARDHQAPYGIQTSLSLEFEPIADTLFNFTFLHVRGVHLGSFFDINQPNPTGTLENGKPDFAALRPLAFCRPCFLDRSISVPGFRNHNFAVYFEADSRWNSVYDGLLINISRRLKKRLSFGVSYTFSKAIDDGPNPSFVLIPENSARIDLERALSSDDARQRLVGNATIAGPTTGHALIRNYRFGLILTLQSPQHFTKFVGFDANGDVFGANDRVGQEARNTFEGDSLQTVDIRVSRLFHVTEKVRTEFIAEAFNLLNTLNVRFFNTVYGDSVFHPANTTITDPLLGPLRTFREGALNPAYGTPRAIFNPRQFQFALRFTF